jgi:hypothetical protein
MKRVCINIPAVEATMLLEIQKVNKAYRDLEGLLLAQIHHEYQRVSDRSGRS